MTYYTTQPYLLQRSRVKIVRLEFDAFLSFSSLIDKAFRPWVRIICNYARYKVLEIGSQLINDRVEKVIHDYKYYPFRIQRNPGNS